VQGYLKRLATSGLAYQASSLVAGFLALFTLPLYTHHLTKAQLGYAETLLTAIILASIVLRFGVGEAFVRFYFDNDDAAHRDRLARRTTSFAIVTSTVAALVAVVFAGAISQVLLGTRDATLMAYGVLGLWAFTNLEIAYAMLRVDERRRTYLIASVSNVLLTVALTVTLVVGFDGGARLRPGQLRGVHGRAVGLWSSRCATASASTCAPRTLGPCCASGRRRSRPTRRLRAQRRRPRAGCCGRLARRRGPLRRVGEARDARHRRRARLSGRAAAGLLDRRRGRGAPISTRW
jgi:hypothetical protein